jgi:ATP-dependent DNA ligase
VADKTKASFIPPMLLVRTEKLPEGENWLYELKLDGYRSPSKLVVRSISDPAMTTIYPRFLI